MEYFAAPVSACFSGQLCLKHRANAGVSTDYEKSRANVIDSHLAEKTANEMIEPIPSSLTQTVATYDAKDCARALRVCGDIYKSLRSANPPVNLNQAAEAAAMRYLSDVERGLGDVPIS